MKRCPGCGRPLTRTLEQNARLWKLYTRLEQRYAPAGVHFSALTWHLFFKVNELGYQDQVLPDGRVVSELRSTTDLDIGEFSDYMTKVEVFAAERGVTLDE